LAAAGTWTEPVVPKMGLRDQVLARVEAHQNRKPPPWERGGAKLVPQDDQALERARPTPNTFSVPPLRSRIVAQLEEHVGVQRNVRQQTLATVPSESARRLPPLREQSFVRRDTEGRLKPSASAPAMRRQAVGTRDPYILRSGMLHDVHSTDFNHPDRARSTSVTFTRPPVRYFPEKKVAPSPFGVGPSAEPTRLRTSSITRGLQLHGAEPVSTDDRADRRARRERRERRCAEHEAGVQARIVAENVEERVAGSRKAEAAARAELWLLEQHPEGAPTRLRYGSGKGAGSVLCRSPTGKLRSGQADLFAPVASRTRMAG
tara:strand:- start:195 stop:1148 length:954 start_codon:yes stop_codon:yes gene_type:complete